MDINRIMEIADEAYDADGVISCYWDAKRRKVRRKPLHGMGDTLARFIAIELAETYDPSATDDEQRDVAARAIQKAADQCSAVADALC
jgi:hydroxymethylpyrimidine/phosphomethylpyrimidine kinase